MRKVSIFYSSITGNTKKLAEYIKDCFLKKGYETELYLSENYVRKGSVAGDMEDSDTPLPQADLYVIAFWCRRSSMDDMSQRILRRLKGQRILALGTIGGKAEGSYGRRVENNVRILIEEENICLASLICQGMISPKRTEARRALPPDDPHYLDDAGYARHISNRGRPSENDLQEIWSKAEKALNSLR